MADASKRGLKALYLRLEESPYLVHNKLMRMGANADCIFVSMAQQFDIEDIEAGIKESGAQVVILDTLSAYLALHGITDENAAGAVAPLMLGFQQLAHRANVGIILIFHSNAQGGIRGSTAFGANVDLILDMKPVGGGNSNRRKFRAKGRIDVDDFTMWFDGLNYRYVDNKASGIEKVFDTIATHPNSSNKTIRAIVGGKSTKVDEWIKDLLDKGRIFDVGGDRAHKYVTYDEYLRIRGTTGDDPTGRPPETHPRPVPPTPIGVVGRGSSSLNTQAVETDSVLNPGVDIDEYKARKIAKAMDVDELGTFGDSADLLDAEEDEREN